MLNVETLAPLIDCIAAIKEFTESSMSIDIIDSVW